MYSHHSSQKKKNTAHIILTKELEHSTIEICRKKWKNLNNTRGGGDVGNFTNNEGHSD